MNNKKFTSKEHRINEISTPEELGEEFQFKVCKRNIVSSLICEEFCYEKELKSFPSKLFSIENIDYVLSEIKHKPKNLQGKKPLSA